MSTRYPFIVTNISEDETPALKAYIPAFDTFVYGDDHAELMQGAFDAIEHEIKIRKQKNLPIPLPEKETKFSGKFMLRIAPALHEKLVLTAKVVGKSLNALVEERLLKI